MHTKNLKKGIYKKGGKMADLSFDVVIIGGGNKALITAMYLTKYGKLSVGIFEERHELGGGWSCEEPSPGFIGNTCSMAHMGYYHTPVYWDFPEWRDYGARYAYTKTSMGTAYIEDDTCFLQYVAFPDVDPNQEKTASEIARFSQRDSDTYLWLWEKNVKYWFPAVLKWKFNPAEPFGKPDPLDELVSNPKSGIDPLWLFWSPLQLFKNLFEDPHLQQGFFRTVQSWGFQADLAGSALGALFGVLTWCPFHCYAVGGSHTLAHASQKVIYENGGKTFTNRKVEKILIENGRAKGIRLQDGTEVEAKRLVVSTVDPYQLIFNFIGKEKVNFTIRRKVETIERDWIALMWYSWAFTERPKYKCEKWNPDAADCLWLALGDLDLDTFKVESSERKLFKWPSKMNIGVAYHGISELNKSDQCLAPPRIAFTLLTEQFTLPSWKLSPKEWKEWEKRHAEEVVSQTARYAPNVSWDIIAGYTPVTPYYTAHQCRNYGPAGNWCVIDHTPAQFGRLRPIPELARHKVPDIKGLYATGSAWHPWGSAHSAQGYNCYKVIAEDYDLPKPWEGRPF